VKVNGLVLKPRVVVSQELRDVLFDDLLPLLGSLFE